MARTWDADEANYLSRTDAVISGPPFTVSIRFIADDLVENYVLWAMGDNSNATNRFAVLLLGAAASGELGAFTKDSSGDGTAINIGVIPSIGTYQHALAVFAGVADRRIFTNGGNKATNTTSITPTGLDRTSIGVGLDNGDVAVQAHRGRICEVTVWDVAFTDSEAARIAAQINPAEFRAKDIKAHCQIHGYRSPEPDFSLNKKSFTVNGTLVRS